MAEHTLNSGGESKRDGKCVMVCVCWLLVCFKHTQLFTLKHVLSLPAVRFVPAEIQ